MKIAIKTLGCKVNQAESASIRGTLIKKGFELVNDEDADVCIINTCTVTAKSDYKSRQLIRKAVKSGAKVIATGCYAQLRPDELAKIKGVELILGNSKKHKLPEYLDKVLARNNSPSVIVNNLKTPLILKSYSSDKVRAFFKIQDGCNFSCSYCAVPLARGKSRSLSVEDVLKGVEGFNTKGYKEVVLTGIHIGSYGLDLYPKSSLLNVVDMLTKTYPDIRFRLSSIEPQEFKNEFLELIKKGNVCSHLHITLQHGSDKILKAMKRGYNVSFCKELISEIVRECPDISIGTDIIVGFPGEDEGDFDSTMKLLEELPISYIHVFPFSKRPNTEAESFNNQVENSIKIKRCGIIQTISNKKKYSYKTSALGKILDVIIEKKDKTSGFYRAISSNYLKPLVKAEGLISGERLKVKAVTIKNEELICIPA